MTQAMTDEYGADAFGGTAVEALDKIKVLLAHEPPRYSERAAK